MQFNSLIIKVNQLAQGDVVNVLDPQYGADPTGAKDSYPAFVAAVATGRIVCVPAGYYVLVSNLRSRLPHYR